MQADLTESEAQQMQDDIEDLEHEWYEFPGTDD